LTQQVEVKTNEEDEEEEFKLYANPSLMPLFVFDFHLASYPVVPNCSGSLPSPMSGRREEPEMFVCLSIKNLRRFVS
jgi:hypothetical protein